MTKRLIALLALLPLSCFAALTQEQKVSDFLALVGLYNRGYAPTAWKQQVFGVNLANVDSWMAQVKASKSDLEFYDICVRYVSSLNDSHSRFLLPAPYYEAWLPLSVDIYDGKVLIDAIDRTVLDPQRYPFAIGDEVVSLDGVTAADWITALGPYSGGKSNPAARARRAAAAIVDRFQTYYPYAVNTQPGDVATLVIRSNGALATYRMDWLIFGLPVTEAGPVLNPKHGALRFTPKGKNKKSLREQAAASANRWGQWTGDPPPRKPGKGPKTPRTDLIPDFPLSGSIAAVITPFPKFNPPPGFQLRLGAAQSDEFLTGTFQAGSSRAGFIRIPSFQPADENAAIQQLQGEITYFQQNTDALVIDVMANPGGSICYMNNVLQYLFPSGFPSIGLAPQGTQRWISYYLEPWRDYWVSVGQFQLYPVYTALIRQTQEALKNHTLAPPMNMCTGQLSYPPARDAAGNNLAYTKPILLLADNFTVSGGDFFTANLQDNGRAFVYGTRTTGGGGSIAYYPQFATPYAEGMATVTESLGIRIKSVSAPGLPPAPLIENIGVLPDVPADFQTKDNLLTGGTPFVQGFLATLTKLIATGHP
jgi:hypothetical protein